MKRRIHLAVLIFYGIIMFWLLFGREAGSADVPYLGQLASRINCIPFHTISRFVRCLLPPFRPRAFRIAAINLFGNILLFLPMGFLPPMIWEKQARLWKVLVTGLIVMTAVELLQLFLLVGTCDIDDLILNGIGIAIGYGFYKLACAKRR